MEILLSFEDARIYDESGLSMPVNLEGGIVRIGTKGDVNKDGEVRSNDATLTLRIAAGLITPTDYQKWAADMNGDGKVRANDATLVLRKAAGLAAPVRDAVVDSGTQVTISLAEVYGLSGQIITVPLEIDNFDSLASGDISITYDPRVLRAVDVSTDARLLLAGNVANPGVVQIAFAGLGGLESRTLAKIEFDIVADDVSPLEFNTVELYQPDASPIDLRKVNANFISWAIAPEHDALLQSFPNPLNPDTWIPYQLKEGSEVEIRIFSSPGELLRVLKLGYKAAGLYVTRDRAAYWDGKNEAGEPVASGVYFYTIQAGEFIATKKMIVAR